MAIASSMHDGRYAQLLGRLSGVYAANVKFEPDGGVAEVHLLTGTSRHPKQLVRDARTALLSAFELDVDYQKFSVAQLCDALGESVGGSDDVAPLPRLKCGDIEQSQQGGRFSVTVSLTQQGAVYTGTAAVRNSAAQRQQAVASATLDAVHQALNAPEPLFALVAVQRVVSTPVPVVVVIVELLIQGQSTLLVGAAEASDGEVLSTQKATLDAVNRRLSVLRVPN